jgi:anthraniloyl-CoA monooxygenase
MTAISETGRITEGCAGIYTQEQIEAWKRITTFIHSHSKTKIGVQIGHSGRKGATLEPWKGNSQPMTTPWKLLAASALPFKEGFPIPKEMSIEEMTEIKMQFKQATINAEQAGFDMIELQAHHGFLLASFLSPLTNIRTDEFGGTIENRLKYPLEVFKEMRSVFPNHKPMSVRISAADWAEGGTSERISLNTSNGYFNLFSIVPPNSSVRILVKGDKNEANKNP